jgi:H+-transporting ATPase
MVSCLLVNDAVKVAMIKWRVPNAVAKKAELEIRRPEVKAGPAPEAKTELKPEIKAEAKPDVNAEPKSEVKAEPAPDAKAEPKPEANAKTSSDVTPQMVKRVHELYEELGREDVQAVQDWEKKERENRKDEPHK